MHGDGHYVYPDGSTFKGNFKICIFDGFGTYTWPLSKTSQIGDGNQRHSYKGNWADGKMHGKGEFTHADGHMLKGFFANNHYELIQLSKKYFVDPFDT